MKKVSIIQDRAGNLHIFSGYNRKIDSLLKDNKGNEAELFFQFEGDIQAIEESLSKSQLTNLHYGYQINAKIDSLYF